MKLANSLFKHVAQLAAAWALGMAAAPLALAQPEAADPPGRVGRLAEMTGPVWLFTQDSGEWVAAPRNQPLTAGDRLSTEAGARAEVRIGSTTVRLDSGSELEFVRLDDERVSLELHNGSVVARLRNRESADEFDLKTAEGRFTTQRAGRYRFDRTDGTSHLTVYSGQSLYEGPRSALTVNSGQHAEFWIDGSAAAQYSITEPRQDAFSAWNNERDRSDDRSVSARYVSPEMTGVEDLDRHGRWEQSPEYGPLWIPRGVASGWAPYSTGHWAWVRPWGWTWVDDSAWGFAPFHYGRWVWYRSYWGWAPGTYVARPVYAPALVAWVGGPSLSVSLSIGGGFAGPAVGWFPLGPREVYVPGYRHSPRYVREVNVTHVTNVNIINAPIGQRDFSNRKFPHAVTVVPTSVMTGRLPVGPVAAQLRDAPAVREFVREQNRHGTLQDAPVAGPVAVARGGEPRQRQGPPAGGGVGVGVGVGSGVSSGVGAGVGPGVDSGGRNVAPGAREGRPDDRRGDRGGRGDRADRADRGDSDRNAMPVAANPVPPNSAPVIGPSMGATRPSPAVSPSAAVIGAPSAPARQGEVTRPQRPERGDRTDRTERTDRGESASRTVQPSPVPAPQVRGDMRGETRGDVRGGQRPAPSQDNRAGANPAATAGPMPAAASVRAAPVERAMPDKRHHSEPPAAPQAAPAQGPERARARAEGQPREEGGDRRAQRERSQMTN